MSEFKLILYWVFINIFVNIYGIVLKLHSQIKNSSQWLTNCQLRYQCHISFCLSVKYFTFFIIIIKFGMIVK